MNQIDCILFDCDGTLVDSEVLCSKAYVHMFAHYGIHLSLEEVFKNTRGEAVRDHRSGQRRAGH